MSTDRPSARIMSHMVAGFPDAERCFDVARALADGGSSYLEVQFPFSDPSADGPTIVDACTRALANHYTTSQGFELVSRITAYTKVPVFIMSYAAVVCARGVDYFVERSRKAGAYGLIVPDLAPGYDEGLYETGRRLELVVVPVVAPNITDRRIRAILASRPSYLYASIRAGITGHHTVLDDDVYAFIRRLSDNSAKVLAGFGIDSRDQVRSLSEHVHALVVGSAFVRAVSDAASRRGSVYDAARARVEDLL